MDNNLQTIKKLSIVSVFDYVLDNLCSYYINIHSKNILNKGEVIFNNDTNMQHHRIYFYKEQYYSILCYENSISTDISNVTHIKNLDRWILLSDFYYKNAIRNHMIKRGYVIDVPEDRNYNFDMRF